MSITLEEALREVDLEAGRTYVCAVNGQQVEVRVLSQVPASQASASMEDEGKIDAWFGSLPLKATRHLRAKPGKMPLPDKIEIPTEDESL
jgi:hypothetical protein